MIKIVITFSIFLISVVFLFAELINYKICKKDILIVKIFGVVIVLVRARGFWKLEVATIQSRQKRLQQFFVEVVCKCRFLGLFSRFLCDV